MGANFSDSVKLVVVFAAPCVVFVLNLPVHLRKEPKVVNQVLCGFAESQCLIALAFFFLMEFSALETREYNGPFYKNE